jgi:hypothetical protein
LNTPAFRTKLAEGLFEHTKKASVISNPMEDVNVALAKFQRNISKNVMGKAVTGASPKQNFDLQLCNYAK